MQKFGMKVRAFTNKNQEDRWYFQQTGKSRNSFVIVQFILLNCVTLAYISSKKMKYIYIYFQGYESSKGLAIIQDFTTH
jgi:hypothetical protein